MGIIRRKLTWTAGSGDLQEREWLVTNGLGGYASGTINGIPTRRYHGLLIAAEPPPLGRVMSLNRLTEHLVIDGERHSISGEGTPGLSCHLSSFELMDGLPVWRYHVHDLILEKRLFLSYRRNSVHVIYRLRGSQSRASLEIRPSFHFRGHNEPVDHRIDGEYAFRGEIGRYEASDSSAVQLRLLVQAEEFSFSESPSSESELCYSIEQERGYECFGQVWSPGHFDMGLSIGKLAVVTASTHSWDDIDAHPYCSELVAERRRRRKLRRMAPPQARAGLAAELVIAADQFVISAPQAPAVSKIIAGYHWFGDWGRDTMISLEGLTLVTGRHQEARRILLTYAAHQKDGLIPNMYPEGAAEGVYNTADATLWYFHALSRYLEASGDREILRMVLPTLREIVEKHIVGTSFGIGVDPSDGLLRQGAEGYQLTWMDAKVGDWVVTPRRGKAVEINALWYNALRLAQKWFDEGFDTGYSRFLNDLATKVFDSFNRRFWLENGGYLLDIVDGEQGDDDAFRPNQILAISLSYPALAQNRWRAVIENVRTRLLTPVGLRTLSSEHREYKKRYSGDLRARDAAYHQGTVWPWLIGPFIDAWLRVNPHDRLGARSFLAGLANNLDEQCVGTIGEIYDAEDPFTPRGCIAQAWSIAETLRSWIKTEPLLS